ncbi:hypothetical protein LTR12_000550 [Friedmanniomyces endolithicus]|nr:hypothetical protein LTR12_000550 [Friedmanniomyces endolithicus]
MPSTTAIINTWRRGSTAASSRKPSKTHDITDEDHVTHPHIEPSGPSEQGLAGSLLQLPPELLSQILSHLTFQDLGAMRCTSRLANNLLSEGDILREWLRQNYTLHLLRLYPPPESVTFTYLSSLQKRYAIATEAAALYTEYIERKIVRHSLMRLSPYLRDAKLKDDFRDVAILMQERMLPLLLTVQHYLESYATLFVNAPRYGAETAKDPATTERWIWERERDILSSYDPVHLVDVYYFWQFLTWTHNQLIRPPSYAGAFERRFRGWKTDPLTSHDLNFIIVFGNLNALSQLLRMRSFRDRQRKVEEWKRVLDPATCYPWRKHWGDFGLEYGATMTAEQAEQALKMKIRDGEVFSNGARAVLIERGLLDRNADTAIGSAQQCTEFLSKIAGYDVLHVLPAHRPTLNVDQDNEWCAACQCRHLATACPTTSGRA